MDKPKFGFTSLHHLGIFWGFLVVTIGTVELWVNGLTGLSFALLPAAIYQPARVGASTSSTSSCSSPSATASSAAWWSSRG